MAITSYVANPNFEDYQQQFAEHFRMERRNGILLLEMHTLGNKKYLYQFSYKAYTRGFRLEYTPYTTKVWGVFG